MSLVDVPHRAATTKDNIGTLPHAMAHNQDARVGGATVNELVDL